VIDIETNIPYLATLSEKSAHDWKDAANNGDCRNLLWPKATYAVRTKTRTLSGNNGIWEF
jgi:hypothetical protein